MLIYQPEKTVQAAAFLVRRHGGKMAYIRLLKLLYLADRAAMGETGHSLTGDQPYAMKNGPVPSRTFDRIREKDWESQSWQECLRTVGYSCEARGSVPTTLLSPLDIDILGRVCDAHSREDDWALVEATHELPEWIDAFPGGNGRAPITEAKLREVLGLQDLAEGLDEQDAAMAAIDRLLAGDTAGERTGSGSR